MKKIIMIAFKSIRHEHQFLERESGTLMIDIFDYVSPLGILGRIADSIFLHSYLKKLLINRNSIIKKYAENQLQVSKE